MRACSADVFICLCKCGQHHIKPTVNNFSLFKSAEMDKRYYLYQRKKTDSQHAGFCPSTRTLTILYP